MAGKELDSIPTALAALAAGGAVVVVDDEDRENEGDIIFAAQFATPELMGFTIRYSSGVICVPLTLPAPISSAWRRWSASTRTPRAPPSPCPAMPRAGSARIPASLTAR